MSRCGEGYFGLIIRLGPFSEALDNSKAPEVRGGILRRLMTGGPTPVAGFTPVVSFLYQPSVM